VRLQNSFSAGVRERIGEIFRSPERLVVDINPDVGSVMVRKVKIRAGDRLL
jgi:hypothetical protein